MPCPIVVFMNHCVARGQCCWAHATYSSTGLTPQLLSFGLKSHVAQHVISYQCVGAPSAANAFLSHKDLSQDMTCPLESAWSFVTLS